MENPTLPTNWLAPLSNANHVRKQKIGQNSLTSLRPAPSAADFRSCQGLFHGTFCRSAMPLAIARTLPNKTDKYEQESNYYNDARSRRNGVYIKCT